MARLARAVFPGHPHHVTQRGNGRTQTFFSDGDYALYHDLLREHCSAAVVDVWAWALMPNHVHLILSPADEDSLRRVLAAVHRRYAGHVHARLGRTGHFWQGRFGCVAMDEAHTVSAVAYLAMNTVRAELVAHAADWSWSSVRTQLGLEDDKLTATGPVGERIPNLATLLDTGEEHAGAIAHLRRAESVGRPVGSPAFLEQLEQISGRRLTPAKRGRRPRSSADAQQAACAWMPNG